MNPFSMGPVGENAGPCQKTVSLNMETHSVFMLTIKTLVTLRQTNEAIENEGLTVLNLTFIGALH